MSPLPWALSVLPVRVGAVGAVSPVETAGWLPVKHLYLEAFQKLGLRWLVLPSAQG